MTPGDLLAALAGGAAAGGIVDVAGSRRGARRRAGRGARVAGALARLGRRVGAPLVPPADLDARIEAAGAPLGLAAADVMAVKGGAAVVALLGGFPLAAALPGRLGVVALLGLPVGGFLAPDGLLARRTRRRAAAMEAELPDLLDLLRVSIEAGLPVSRALGEVGRRHPGPLGREWAAAAERLALGMPREVTLARLARRCPLPAMATLVAALQRAERHGAPLAGALAAQARDARAERARRIRERAARAGPKIQLVVALLLVPSVLLLVAAGLVATLWR